MDPVPRQERLHQCRHSSKFCYSFLGLYKTSLQGWDLNQWPPDQNAGPLTSPGSGRDQYSQRSDKSQTIREDDEEISVLKLGGKPQRIIPGKTQAVK